MSERRFLNSRLLCAIQLNQPETVENLLQAGADPHGLTVQGNCPFTQFIYILAACASDAVAELAPEIWNKRLAIARLLGISL